MDFKFCRENALPETIFATTYNLSAEFIVGYKNGFSYEEDAIFSRFSIPKRVGSEGTSLDIIFSIFGA